MVPLGTCQRSPDPEPALPPSPPWLALSFDLDGTLAEVRWRKAALWRGVLRHGEVILGFGPVVESLRGQRFPDLDAEIRRRLAARTGRSEAEVGVILEEWIDRRWPASFRGARPPPSVARLLARGDQLGLPRVVVSDHPPEAKLRAMGLAGWAATVGCRRLGAFKPAPDGLLEAARLLGIPPQRILHVGDRPETDGGMAAAAGAGFVSVAQLDAGLAPLDGGGPPSSRNPARA